jgi:hypothetical protein
MLPPQTPVDQRLGATSRSCSRAGLRTKTTVALSRAEAREPVELLPSAGLGFAPVGVEVSKLWLRDASVGRLCSRSISFNVEV